MVNFSEKRKVYDVIYGVQGRLGVVLTVPAGEMLAIPVMEWMESGQTLDWNTVEQSIFAIVDEAKRNWRRPDEETNGMLNAKGIIRGFHAQFCNIPPFCGPT
jgi:hypothetical protein